MKKHLIYSIFFLIYFSCQNPKNPTKQAGICLSFDDKSVNEWYELLPLFKKYNATATFFVTQPQELNDEEIQKLQQLEKAGFEIGFHGYHHKSAEHYIRKHSYKEYMETEIYPGIQFMDSIGVNCRSFAYPYGAQYWFTDYLLLRHFDAVRDVSPLNKEKDLTNIDAIFNDFRGDKSLSAIGIDNKTGLTISMINQAFDRAKKNREAVLLYGHIPTDEDRVKGYYFQKKFLEEILKSAQNKNLVFYTISGL